MAALRRFRLPGHARPRLTFVPTSYTLPPTTLSLKSFLADLDQLASTGPQEIAAATTLDEWTDVRNALVGRQAGRLTAILEGLGRLAKGDRREAGLRANAVKVALEGALEARQAELARAAASDQPDLDLTMPPRLRWQGGVHPVSLVMDEVVAIFRELGFTIALGPEAEHAWYNFGALNFPDDHPAMDLHDTLYLGADQVLRTHTSPVQVRTLQQYPPPVRILAPGNVYRRDFFDPSHAPMFAQIEGLVVDEGVTFADLKATLTHFAQRFFGADTTTRFRPSYFPFTEPSAEMDVRCGVCGGSGCAVCKHSGWLEILGRDGAPGGARGGGARQREVHRVGVRDGPGAHGAFAARDPGHPHPVRFRRAIPRAVHAMNLSHAWLSRFVPHGRSAEQVRDLLTAHVATVDAIEPLRGDLAPFVVARVVESEKIPDTKLSFNKVDDGSGELLEVVCGAPNVAVGAKYPFARTGTVMPGGMQIEKRKIRGFTSNGMLCSARELGLGEDHEGIYTLETDAAPGTPLLQVMPAGDVRLVLDVLPNRSDLLSHLGVARELSAITGVKLAGPAELADLPPIPVAPVTGAQEASAGGVRVRVEDAQDCARYTAAVISGVTVCPSPTWLREAIEAIGGRSINNVVDATNYMLHGFGQPMHAFDRNNLGGSAIVVRRAKAGEKLVTLDGVERTLDRRCSSSPTRRRRRGSRA